ncbi:MAG TPA: hypothetical protein VHC69_28365 [Polyangiaceae bacterium]|nr:hypothetical protein [Polyangiaceae bacterium]
MARRSLSALALGAALFASACETRSVFLVPRATESGGGGGATVIHVGDAGRAKPPHKDAGVMPASGGSSSAPDSGPTEDSGDLACVTTRAPQVPQPLGVYMIIDQSYAMLAQWAAVSAGLQTFISGSDELGGVSIGIQYYAISPPASATPAYSDIVCLPETYETPDVPMAALPMNQQPLLDSINLHGPTSLAQLLSKLSLLVQFKNESPIDAAILGATQRARDWVTENGSQNPAAVVLLVTNGVASSTDSPNCMPSVEKAALAAEAGLINGPSVSTYVLAVGGPNSDLDQIAMNGGTSHAYPVTSGSDVLTNLIQIRQAFLPCDVTVSVTDQDLAQNKLNVELREAGKSPVRYGRVASADACSASASPGEWYVEGTGADTKVRLCPSTCEAVRLLPDATLDVVHGCKTTVIP